MKHKVYMNYIHSSSMLSYFSELWKNGSLCDLVITVDSMVVAKAHRLVLLAASPKLQADHSNTSTPLVSDICMPGNVSIESIETCLAYIYDGILELNEGNISDVKKIAEYLHIEQLLHCCIDFSENIMGNSDKLPDINKTFHIKKSNLMDSSSKSSTACKKCSNQSNSSFKFAAGVSNTNSGNEDIYSDNSSNTVSNESFDIGNNSASNIPRSVKRQKLSEDSFRTPSREPVTIKIDDDEATIVKMEPDDSENYTNMSEPYPVSFVPSSHSDETTGNNVGSSMQTVSSSSHNLQPSTSQDIDAESCSTAKEQIKDIHSAANSTQSRAYQDNFGLKIFHEWAIANEEYRNIEEIPVKYLDVLLARFYRGVKKKDGSEYVSESILSIRSVIDHYITSLKLGYSIKDNKIFPISYKALEIIKKERFERPFTDEEINWLCEKNILGPATPTSLLSSVLLSIKTYTGLMKGKEHRRLLWGDVILKQTNDGTEYLELNDCSAGRMAGGICRIFEQKGNPICPIKLYKLYRSHRPPNTYNVQSSFYLAPFCNVFDYVWYMDRPIGKVQLTSLMRKITESLAYIRTRGDGK